MEAMLAYMPSTTLYMLILGPQWHPALEKLLDGRCKVGDNQWPLVVIFVFEGCLCIVSLMYSFFP
jgi:hypothetical protein